MSCVMVEYLVGCPCGDVPALYARRFVLADHIHADRGTMASCKESQFQLVEVVTTTGDVVGRWRAMYILLGLCRQLLVKKSEDELRHIKNCWLLQKTDGTPI